MKKTIEKGKTLLVDGPASVTVTSGKVDVFGCTASNTFRAVIREGKRLPFVVLEAATVDISLGEGAGCDEVDGSTIPPSWQKASEELMTVGATMPTVLVVGAADCGKTSFCTYLVNKLVSEKKKVAILDGDLGQSDIGPPCTVAYTIATKALTDLFDLRAKNAVFAGCTSPNTRTQITIEGLTSLRNEILVLNPDAVVINTDGWIEGDLAVSYKVQLIEKLKPHIVFCIQQKDELDPFANALVDFRVSIVESPVAIRQRTIEKRRSLRELGYGKYLRNAKVQSLMLNWLKIEDNDLFGLAATQRNLKRTRRVYELLGMRPLHLAELADRVYVIIGKRRWIDGENIEKVEHFANKKVIVMHKGEEEGLLVGLLNAERKFLGIGVVQEIDYLRRTLKIFTPVSKDITTVVFGKVRLDKNLKEIAAAPEEDQPESTPF